MRVPFPPASNVRLWTHLVVIVKDLFELPLVLFRERCCLGVCKSIARRRAVSLCRGSARMEAVLVMQQKHPPCLSYRRAIDVCFSSVECWKFGLWIREPACRDFSRSSTIFPHLHARILGALSGCTVHLRQISLWTPHVLTGYSIGKVECSTGSRCKKDRGNAALHLAAHFNICAAPCR